VRPRRCAQPERRAACGELEVTPEESRRIAVLSSAQTIGRRQAKLRSAASPRRGDGSALVVAVERTYHVPRRCFAGFDYDCGHIAGGEEKICFGVDPEKRNAALG
jgi:hypothetical protein